MISDIDVWEMNASKNDGRWDEDFDEKVVNKIYRKIGDVNDYLDNVIKKLEEKFKIKIYLDLDLSENSFMVDNVYKLEENK